jgi:hypothetical protein
MRIFLVAFGLALSGSQFDARADVILGVLQDISEEHHEGVRRATNLRLGFRATPEGWVAVCASRPNIPWDYACRFPIASAARWTITYGGKPLGEVVTDGAVSQEWYKDAGLLRVRSQDVPRVGNRATPFIGWTGGEVHRPLMAFFGGARSYRPWTAEKPSKQDALRVFPAFRSAVPRFLACTRDEEAAPLSTVTRPAHFEVFAVLRSPAGERLIGTRIRWALVSSCDGALEDASDVWFIESKDHRFTKLVHGLDANGFRFTLTPIEAGDFDGDGRDEALFWFSGYNEDGLVLFHDDFTRTVKFTWGFH